MFRFLYKRTTGGNRRYRGYLGNLLQFLLLMLAGGAVLYALPVPAFLLSDRAKPTVRITDRNGLLLYEAQDADSGHRERVALHDVPPFLIQALIATEDRTFLRHHGISVRGIARALLLNVRSGRVVSGGSTLTQQLARIRLRPQRRRMATKLLEAALALKIELHWDKERILEEYLQSAYFGHRAYGIASAAKVYFGKSVRELTAGELALLAGLVQSPSRFDPFAHPEAAQRRQAAVLRSTREAGMITREEEEEILRHPIRLAPDRVPIRAPHFVMWVLGRDGEMSEREELKTTLDLLLQTEVEGIVERHMHQLRDKNATSAAVVVLDARTGDILAMVGSSGYFDALHDGAVNVALSPRQPGSAIKPFTYALALVQGETAASTVEDRETQFLTKEGYPYTPRNYDFEEHGTLRYRAALANSYNIAAVKVLERVTVERLLLFLRDAGITTLTGTADHYGLALTLGDAEVPLLELSRAYGLFARGGRTFGLRSLLDDPMEQGRQILDPRIAWLVTDILADAEARIPEFGEENPLRFDMPVAAKTGTTRNARDNWTIGYTPDRIVGVWVGNANNSPMKGTSGITGAGPIFHDVMLVAQKGLPNRWFHSPSGLVRKHICAVPSEEGTACTRHVFEHFLAEAVPAQSEGTQWTDGLRILQPHDGDRYALDPLVPDDREKIALRAELLKGGEVEWFVNGERIDPARGSDGSAFWQLTVGKWIIEARAGGQTARVSIEVKKRAL